MKNMPNGLRHIARLGLAAIAATGFMTSVHAEDITIKMWTLDNNGYEEFIKQAADAFRATHPNVTIKHQMFPGDPYKTGLQVALVGSDGPDVFFNWSGDDAKRLVNDGLALDITDLGNAEGGFATFLGQGWLDAFRYDGKLYGVPADAVSKYFFYNKGYFSEHNLSVPTTFAELKGLCKAVRDIDPDTVPMPMGNKTRWKAIHWMTMLNQRMIGVAGTAADYDLSRDDADLFTDPGYAAAFQKLVDLQDAGCFEDAPNATDYAIADTMFTTGASPMEYCGTWCASAEDKAGFTDYGLFRFPTIEGGKGDPGTNFLVPEGFQVNVKTAHPKEAVEWLNFLVSADEAVKFSEYTGMLPSNAEKIDQVPGATEQFKWIAADVASFTGTANVLDVLLDGTVAEAYLNATVEVLNHTKTPEEAMADIRAVALEVKHKAN